MKYITKIINNRTGREFTDIDNHLLAYAKSDPGTFQLVYADDAAPEPDDVFSAEDLKAMSMKSLKEIYALMEEKYGESMPKARKNSPAEIIQAIMKAQEE